VERHCFGERGTKVNRRFFGAPFRDFGRLEPTFNSIFDTVQFD